MGVCHGGFCHKCWQPGAFSSSVPALLVWGELDSPESSKAKAREKLFSLSEKVVMPKAPHPCYLKDPQTFNRLVLKFAGVASEFPIALDGLPLKLAAAW